ncbi:MAG: hypothetical protein GY772_08035 [bacterium]|nr:hypothetical protein [bacterium]
MAAQPVMLLQMPTQQQVQQPSEADKKKGEITTGSVPIWKLPRVRLAEAAEHVAEFDSAMSADLDQITLAVLLWCLTRIKPNLRVTELRSSTYLELYGTCKVAAERVKKTNESKYNSMVDSLKASPSLSQETVMSEAILLGFKPEWLEETTKRQRGDGESSKQALKAM